jgi:hypothetical protein
MEKQTMDDYDIKKHEKELIKTINKLKKCKKEDDDIGEWLDQVPKVAETCIYLYEETNDAKYGEMLVEVLDTLDRLLLQTKTNPDNVEQRNILRIKLKRMRNQFK